jgi:hypothetical protein
MRYFVVSARFSHRYTRLVVMMNSWKGAEATIRRSTFGMMDSFEGGGGLVPYPIYCPPYC